jgi:hypothetical protein
VEKIYLSDLVKWVKMKIRKGPLILGVDVDSTVQYVTRSRRYHES